MAPQPHPPTVLFEDAHLIVIDKPAGFLSQGGSRDTGTMAAPDSDNVVDWLRARWGRPYVGLVHRLDRNTSGLMVVAKRTKAANRLTASLQAGEIDRRYLAWLEGALEAPVKWRHWLVKNEAKNLVTARSTPTGRPGEQEAILMAEPIRREALDASAITLASIRLETGRSHQIRAQAGFEGHPLVGDRKYGSRVAGPDRPALHSFRLRFPHPIGSTEMVFESPLPADLEPARGRWRFEPNRGIR